MKNSSKLLLAGLLALGAANSTFAQNPLNDTLTFVLNPGIIDPGPHKPHLAPANVSLPLCVFNGYSLLFIGTGAASFTYEILDETDEICLSGELELVAEQEIPVSLSTLPAGDYTILLYIAGREYEGEFTIE